MTLLADVSTDRTLLSFVLHRGVNHVSQSDGEYSSTAREGPPNVIPDASCGDHGASIPEDSGPRPRSFHQLPLPLALNCHVDQRATKAFVFRERGSIVAYYEVMSDPTNIALSTSLWIQTILGDFIIVSQLSLLLPYY